MEIVYASKKVEQHCTNVKFALKLFGGEKILVQSLLARIVALENAETIKDIIIQPQFKFHALRNVNRKNLEGLFAIDVKTHKDPWRIILQMLDENKEPVKNTHIDEIASHIRIVKIMEVSKHYE